MSLAFSDTTNKNGIIQRIERACGFQDGGISGDTTLLRQFTGSVNEALNRAVDIALRSSGRWQFHDTNHTSYPEKFIDLVSGTRRYQLTTDEDSNLILEVYKLFIKDENDYFIELAPRDPQTDPLTDGFTSGQNQQGLPHEYELTGKWIDLNPVPDYSKTDGIKVLINSEPSYFLYTDTTKKPGISGSFHEYCVLRPSYEYCRDRAMPQTQGLQTDMLLMERDIAAAYQRRDRDSEVVIMPPPTYSI